MIRSSTLISFVFAVAAAGQTRPAWDGAFTQSQAERGRAAYRESCARCHGQDLSGGESSPALAGASFLSHWNGKGGAELLGRTRRTMPTDNPAGLSNLQYGDIVAYVMSVNGFRAGRETTAPASSRTAEWRFYGSDAGSTKYSPLAQIDASNVSKLHSVWSWKAQNFGAQPEFNWEVTPLMVGGRLFLTAGTRRDAVALDARTGETLWMYRLDEGARGAAAARSNNRGLAYWTDGRDERILLISPGYQLVALDARTGRPLPDFGKDGVVDLWEGLDREVKPGDIGASSPAIVVRDVVVVGAALQQGVAPRSKKNVPGYIRGYDVHTGKRLWTFHTIAQPGEFGLETWEKGSWEYTGNTGAWGPLSADEELGYVYVPVETPTGDFYGGHRPGNDLFGESLVCLEARTGRRVWHFQMVHHGVWDWDPPTSPTLLDITVQGRQIKAVAQITKQGWVYVFDRVNGQPVWPIEERPVPQTDVPGERTSPTQPFPSKPAAYDKQGITVDDLIDFTPALKTEALKIASQYRLGGIFTPPSVAGAGGKEGNDHPALADRRRQLARRSGRPGDRDAVCGVGNLRRAGGAGARFTPHRHGLFGAVRARSHRARGAAAGKTAMGTDHGDRTQHGRTCLDDAERLHAGLCQVSSGAEGGRPWQNRQSGARANPGDEEFAVHRRRRRDVRDAAGFGRSDVPRAGEEHRQGSA